MSKIFVKLAFIIILLLLSFVPHGTIEPLFDSIDNRELYVIAPPKGQYLSLITFKLKNSSIEKLNAFIKTERVNTANIWELSKAFLKLFPLQKKTVNEQLDALIQRSEYYDSFSPFYVLRPEEAFKEHAMCLEKSIFVVAALRYLGYNNARLILLDNKEYYKEFILDGTGHAFVLVDNLIIDPSRHKVEHDIQKYLADFLVKGDFEVRLFTPAPLNEDIHPIFINRELFRKKTEKTLTLQTVEEPDWGNIFILLEKNKIVKKKIYISKPIKEERK